MRILLSAYACEPNKGSELGNGWNWAKHLAQAGHDVQLLTRPQGKKAIEGELNASGLPNLRVSYADVPRALKPLLKGRSGVYLHYLLWQWEAYQVAKSLSKEARFDVVHHVSWGSLVLGSFLGLLGLPFVFGPVGGGQVAPPAFACYFQKHWRIEALRSFFIERLMPLNPLTRSTLRRADLILVTNRETEALVKRLGAKQVELFLDAGLPPDYGPEALPLREPGPALRVLWVARLFPIKGLRLSLEALSLSKIPFHLTIVGDGPLGPSIPGWLEEYGLAGRVDWRGQLPWAEVRKTYRESDVFLFTSLRDSFGAQLLEAMSQGLPIVALDHHGGRDMIPAEAGFKVPVTVPQETSRALAEALEKLYRFPEMRREMGKKGFAFAKANRWPAKVAAMSALYSRLVSRREGF